MPDSANPADASASSTEAGSWSRAEIEAAIAGLDRATRKFTSRVDALNRARPTPPPRRTQLRPRPYAHRAAPTRPPAARRPARAAAAERAAADPATAAASSAPAAALAPPLPRPRHADSFDEQMQEAERAAREYLDRAKTRADSLVTTMIAAVEREAGEIRREAEEGIRERWHAVELEAGRYLDGAREVAEGMVAERQSRDRLALGRDRRPRAGAHRRPRGRRPHPGPVRRVRQGPVRDLEPDRRGGDREGRNRRSQISGLGARDFGEDALAA